MKVSDNAGGRDVQALSIPVPKLPELDKDDIKAVRSFLPGKLLSRCAALLALAVLVLSFAGLVDQGLKRLLDVDLSSTPTLHYALLFGLPLFAVTSQLVLEWRAEYQRRVLQRLAVQAGVEQLGYFRIGPYLNKAEDHAKFDRADRAHEKVLDWIERSASVIPLYLTGDSGSGKSSLLNAFVFPALQERGWIVIEARAWQDPETALRNALSQVSGTRRLRQGKSQPLPQLLATAARAAGGRLLLVLDQFEEFLILRQQAQQERFAALIASLKAAPIPGLSLLLVLRSDYQTLLDEVGLPPPRHSDNFFQVGRFTTAAAASLMARSGLDLHPDTVDRLLTSAAELDETPGLVRPITLNVIGYVLATGKAIAVSADAGRLVHRYIELTVGQPAIRDFAPRVLGQLVTEQGTKRPHSEQELMAATDLRHGEVRAVMNGLADAALARPLDPTEGVWELSHDFVARAVMRFLGLRRHKLRRRAAFYAAPALLSVMLLVSTGVVVWDRFSSYEIRSQLEELGLSVHTTADGLIAERNSNFTPKTFLSIAPLLAKLPPIRSLDLTWTPVNNLDPLKGLTSLRSLNLVKTQVTNLEPLRDLIALQSLNLTWTSINNLEPLKGLTSLRSLDITGTSIDNLGPLKGLTALWSLALKDTQVNNLEPVNGLTSLKSLDLTWTPINNIEPLRGLTALRSVELSGTQINNLEPLKGLTALRSLDLSGTLVINLEPLKGLTALRSLALKDTQVNNLEPVNGLISLKSLDLTWTPINTIEPLKGLTALWSLELSGTQINNLEPLKGLTALQSLDLSSTAVNNLEPLKGLAALRSLNLSKTRVTNLEPLRGLTALQSLDLSSTAVINLEPLKGLIALRSLNLSKTLVANLEPLKHLAALQQLELSNTPVTNLEPLKSLTALHIIR